MLEEALEYIESQEDGVLQSDLWKVLGIDSRKCSRIVSKLMKEELITRESESSNGIRTYRLRCTKIPESNRFMSLIAGDTFEPCAGCIAECTPEHCAELSEWVYSIVICETSDVTITETSKGAGVARTPS